MLDSLKQKFVRTRFYPTLLELRSIFENIQIISKLAEGRGCETVYCISPYKAGTTYCSGLFDCKSMHDPFMYTTIKHINNSKFLFKRSRLLALDIECSGFSAGKLGTVRSFSPESKVAYLSRRTEVWIGSVVNYFSKLNDKISYNSFAGLIFDPIFMYPIEDFYSLDASKQRHFVSSLMHYWIKVYSSGEGDNRALVIPLNKLDDRISQVEAFTGLKAKQSKGIWKSGAGLQASIPYRIGG